MGQVDVFNWLKMKRMTGSDEYYSVNEVASGMKNDGYKCPRYTVRLSLLKLENYKFLEVQMPKDRNWKMKFRLKEQYVDLSSTDR